MINSFENYLKAGKVRSKTIDPEESKSLLEKAQRRISFVKNIPIDENNKDFLFENAYASIREAAQSLMSLKGFKPYSHEATISFIKRFYGIEFNEENISSFDRFRDLRNNSVYKAEPVQETDTGEVISFAVTFVQIIEKLHKKQAKTPSKP